MDVVLRVVEGPHQGREYTFNPARYVRGGALVPGAFLGPGRRVSCRAPHFLIEFNPPLCFLRDLESTNGTKVNGQRVETARLNDGDVIRAGKERLLDPRRAYLGRDPPGQVPRLPHRRARRRRPRGAAGRGGRSNGSARRASSSAASSPRRPRDTGSSRGSAAAAWARSTKGRNLADGRAVAIKMMVPTVAAQRPRPRLLPPRDGRLAGPPAPEHRRLLRGPGGRGAIRAGHGIRPRLERPDLGLGPPQARSSRALRRGSACNCSRPWSTPTRRGTSTRDIKPSNLIVTGPCLPARREALRFRPRQELPRPTPGSPASPLQGDIGGSVGFLSPDHIRDFRQVKEPADIYSARGDPCITS